MASVSSVKISIPTRSSGEIIRKKLVSAILSSQKKLTYIHAGAGYGKTTLLAQVRNSVRNPIWLTLDGENDIFSFLSLLRDAVHHTFSCHELNFSQYIPFKKKNNFIPILANAFISSIENISQDCTIVLDDLHTVQDKSIKDFVTCLVKYKPESIRICVGSRETPWPQLVALKAKDDILELCQKEIAFTRQEAAQVLGFENEDVYTVTEGWPLGIRSFRVLFEHNVDIAHILANGNEILDSYLFCECTGCLPNEMTGFLRASACFEELDPKMLDAINNRTNSRNKSVGIWTCIVSGCLPQRHIKCWEINKNQSQSYQRKSTISGVPDDMKNCGRLIFWQLRFTIILLIWTEEMRAVPTTVRLQSIFPLALNMHLCTALQSSNWNGQKSNVLSTV